LADTTVEKAHSKAAPNLVDIIVIIVVRVVEKVKLFYSTNRNREKLLVFFVVRLFGLVKNAIQERLQLSNELSLAQMVVSPLMVPVMVNEFITWLNREGHNKSLLSVVNDELKNGQPVPLSYEKTYPNMEPELKNKHRAALSKVGKWSGDILSCTIQHMIVIMSCDKRAKYKYMRLLHLYLHTRKHKLDSNPDAIVKDMANMAEVLRRIRDMRLKAINPVSFPVSQCDTLNSQHGYNESN